MFTTLLITPVCLMLHLVLMHRHDGSITNDIIKSKTFTLKTIIAFFQGEEEIEAITV